MDEQLASPFPRILVPLDGSTLAEQALPYARAIGGPEAEMVLLSVVPPVETLPRIEEGGLLELAAHTVGMAAAAQEAMEERAAAMLTGLQERYELATAEHLRTVARAWLGESSNVAVRVVTGDPAEEILRVAEDVGADLVVLASHGRGAVGRSVFGSVADRVAHASPVPVMIIRPQDAHAEMTDPVLLGRLLVPLDRSDLSMRALPIAEALARRLGLPVHLLHALNPTPTLGPLAAPVVVTPTYFEDADAAARSWLEGVATPLRAAGLTVTTDVQLGLAFPTIVEAAQPGDVIVLCSHGRGGVRRWLLGSVAEKLVRAGPVPVILVPAHERAAQAAERRATRAT